MSLSERLDAVCDRWNVLRHPFYRRWERGELTRDDLAYYAGEYRHAASALAELAASASTPEHAAEERAHVTLWDAFAHVLDARLDRAPREETQACLDAWSGAAAEPVAALYAIEATQPEVARTKRAGLVRCYGFDEASPSLAYFDVHAERDVEHAAQSRATLVAADSDREDAIVAAAERALCGNWTLLDGVDRYVTDKAAAPA
jgi:pyrroloquinoline-quinone synthase